MEKEIIIAKCKLFILLHSLNEEQITDNECDIMFLLAKDKDIQEIIEQEINQKI